MTHTIKFKSVMEMRDWLTENPIGELQVDLVIYLEDDNAKD